MYQARSLIKLIIDWNLILINKSVAQGDALFLEIYAPVRTEISCTILLDKALLVLTSLSVAKGKYFCKTPLLPIFELQSLV